MQIVLVLLLVVLFVPANAKAEWQPPFGVPVPPFGIEESHHRYTETAYQNPALSYTVGGHGPYTHYVDNTAVNCTGSGFGSVDTPLCSIPSGLPPGSVVEVHGGPYNENSGFVRDWVWFSGVGTDQWPIIIRGAQVNAPPVIQGMGIRVGGEYLIIENFELVDTSLSLHKDYSGPKFEHIAFRNIEIHGQTNDRGSMVSIGGQPTIPARNIVAFQNHIHHNGNVPVGGGTDVHGVLVGGYAQNVWIVDNEIHHNDGDSVQVNACGGSCCKNDEWSRYIYIARNHLYADRENAVDFKDSEDVIVSQNRIHGYTIQDRVYGSNPAPRPIFGSDGTAILPANEGGRMTWILFNEIYDSEHGLRMDDECVVGNARVVGNLFHSIYGDAVLTWRTMNLWLVNNTFHDIAQGFVTSRGWAPVHDSQYVIVNNVFSKMHGNSDGDRNFLDLGSDTAAAAAELSNNLFYDGSGFYWGSTLFPDLASFQATGACADCLAADPEFNDAATGDFAPGPASRLIDAGKSHPVYTQFSDLYRDHFLALASPLESLDIARDFNGAQRIGVYDIGAFEDDGRKGRAGILGVIQNLLAE